MKQAYVNGELISPEAVQFEMDRLMKFYLEHETERKRIEDNGYETVRKHFNYPEVLKKMLHISNLDNLLK